MSMGFMVYSQGVVASAAREATRYVAIHGEAGVDAILENSLRPVIPGGDYTRNVIIDDIVEVSITYNYDPFVDFGLILGLFGRSDNPGTAIRGIAHFKNERPGE